jgi:hypothetical protein
MFKDKRTSPKAKPPVVKVALVFVTVNAQRWARAPPLLQPA